MEFLNNPVYSTASVVELAWTLLNLAAMLYVLRNLLWLVRFYRYSTGHAHSKGAVDEARDYIREESGRLVVAVLFTGVGVAAMFTPPPELQRVSVLQTYEALVFLLAAVVNLANSYLTHRRLVR